MSPPPAAPGADLRPQSACAKLGFTTTPAPRDDEDGEEEAASRGGGDDAYDYDDVGASTSTSSSGGGARSSSSLSSDAAAPGAVPWRGRPSWLAEAGAGRGRPSLTHDELVARRKTDPCDYRAELLWQPYDCRSRSSTPESTLAVVGAAALAQLEQPELEEPQPSQCAGDCGRAGTMAAGVRTFTSTEAQTDDLPPALPPPATAAANVTSSTTPTVLTREQRRRERRQQRRAGRHPPPGASCSSSNSVDRLPDLLHSHLPPPYSTLPLPPLPLLQTSATPVPVAATQPPPPPVPPPALVTTTTTTTTTTGTTGIRFPFQISPAGRRRSRRHYTGEEEPKSCCGVVVTQTVSIRWFILMIAFVGVCCAVVGTVLGAMKAQGREHLTVSLLMIGVGVVLVTVSAVAWRLTAHDAPSCRSMLGLGGGDGGGAEPNRRFVPRLPPSYGRPHHPYAAMMYPEFQYRAPPPSYQASMQEYRLRLLLLDRSAVPPHGHAVSPPPTYRSHSGGSTLRAPLGLRRDSRPPSYRSRTSSTRPNNHSSSITVLDPEGGADHVDSCTTTTTVVGDGVGGGEAKVRLVLDHNLVTIVQTEDSPVIVTVSGSTPIMGGANAAAAATGEMEILAHL